MSGIMGRAPIGNEPPAAPRSVALGQIPQMRIAIVAFAIVLICGAMLTLLAGNSLLAVILVIALLLALIVGVATLLRASKLRDLLQNGDSAVAVPSSTSAASVGGRKAIGYSYSVGDMHHAGTGTVNGDLVSGEPGAGFWVIYDPADPTQSAPWNG